MTLEIGTTESFARTVSFLIHGDPGVGKTTLATTLPAKDDNRVLYVAADPGQLALRKRKFVCAKVTGANFLSEIYKHLKENKDKYDWVYFDGLNETGEIVLKAAREEFRSSSNQYAAFNKLDEVMDAWIRAMLDLGINIVFVTHTECDSSSDIPFGPMHPGIKFTNKLLKLFDEVGCMRMLPRQAGEEKAKRVIQFSREYDTRYAVKDRSGALSPLEEPNLANIMGKIFANKDAK